MNRLMVLPIRKLNRRLKWIPKAKFFVSYRNIYMKITKWFPSNEIRRGNTFIETSLHSRRSKSSHSTFYESCAVVNNKVIGGFGASSSQEAVGPGLQYCNFKYS
jgi:hypothetical protein